MRKRLLIVIVMLLPIFVIWFMSEKSDSYAEPQEALLAIDADLLLIPAYKINNKGLFFFIKDSNDFGAAYVRKGLFGWKAGMRTWSNMNYERSYETLSGYHVSVDSLIFGLIKHGDERMIQIGGNVATK